MPRAIDALLPFSLQAMDAPKKLSKIEKELVALAITQNGLETILTQVNQGNFQTLIIKEKFDRNINSPLSQRIFSKIDKIEATPRTSPAPRNYLGSETRYFFKPSNQQNKIEITARLSNAQEIRQICAGFDQ